MTVCACPALREYAAPDAMLKGGTVVAAPTSVPDPGLLTLNARAVMVFVGTTLKFRALALMPIWLTAAFVTVTATFALV